LVGREEVVRDLNGDLFVPNKVPLPLWPATQSLFPGHSVGLCWPRCSSSGSPSRSSPRFLPTVDGLSSQAPTSGDLSLQSAGSAGRVPRPSRRPEADRRRPSCLAGCSRPAVRRPGLLRTARVRSC
jgi:hypothetical protein